MAKRRLPPLPDAQDLFSRANVVALAPDEASIPAAEKVLKKGGFGKVEASADGKGWWVVCRGLTDTYQVSLRIDRGRFECDCTCPSPKYPCKHAIALVLYLHNHPEERVEPETPKRAAADFEALLRNVFRNPDDDTARLVFADYLDENDQPDRAALIRLQVERAKLSPRSGRAKALAAEEKPLIARLRKAAVDPLPEGVEVEFRRGFLRLTANLSPFHHVDALPDRFVRLFRDGWVESFGLDSFSYSPITDKHWMLLEGVGEIDFSRLGMLADDYLVEIVARTAEMTATGRLCRVRVAKRVQKEFDRLTAAHAGQVVNFPVGRVEQSRGYSRLTPPVFDLLRAAGRFQAARQLILDGQLGDREAHILARTDLNEVEALHLNSWALSAQGIAALANAPNLSRLTTFSIGGSLLEAEHISALARGPVFARLQWLFLDAADLTDQALAPLGAGVPFRNLQNLDLVQNNLTAAGIGALLRSPNFPSLTRLFVTGNRVGQTALLPLALDASNRPAIALVSEGLNVSTRCDKNGVHVGVETENRIGPGFFVGVDRTAAKRVTGLRLSRARMEPRTLTAIANTFDPDALRAIEFRDLQLRNDGVAEFVAAFKDYKLRTLRVVECRIQAIGVAALVDSPVVESVKTLDLTGNNIGKAGVAGLLRSTHLKSLERLELTDWMPGYMNAERQALRKKFGKKLVLS